MEIYLIRHGQTPWNQLHKFQGQTDIELNENGREAAGRTGEALEKISFDRIYSSTLIRAYETANLIRGHRNIQIIRDSRLMEIGFGELEGLSAQFDREDKTNPFYYFYQHPECYQAPKGGESFDQVCRRTAEFMEQEIEPNEEKFKRIMIVGHGACNKGLMCHVKNHGVDQYWEGGMQKNCEAVIIRLENGHYQVLEENKLLLG